MTFFLAQIPCISPADLFIIDQIKHLGRSEHIWKVNVGWAFLKEVKALCPEERHLH